MFISNIKITNFKGIKGDEFDSSPLTCIIGENNAGKSSILLATSLFFSGTSLNSYDYFDLNQPIDIEVEFSEVTENDLNRLIPEHKERISEIVEDGKITFNRRYSFQDNKSVLLCKMLSPIDERFLKDNIDTLLKGKKKNEINGILYATFPEYASNFQGKVETQAQAKELLQNIILQMPVEQKQWGFQPLPTGIENSIKNFLPEPIYIPAVKDIRDDIKSKESATFGKILSILLRIVEKSEHFDSINNSFEQLHGLLNIKRENGKESDNRIPLLSEIEKSISNSLAENFPTAKIEIEIPKPELKQIFSNAKILVDDGVRDVIDSKGDGIKRALTFALLKTFIEQSRNQKTNTSQQADEQPYLFLFEEPELYLHPNAQRTLFDSLESLTSLNNQVFVTTHSPTFFSPQSTGTFIKVKKIYQANEKPYAKFLKINFVKDNSKKDAFQIICYENNSAAFFSDKVVFVEGDSDLIFLKELALLFSSEWDFDKKNIPIISINGKNNVSRFTDFYNTFDIQCYCIVDSDALIDGFEKFKVTKEINDLRNQLLQEMDAYIQSSSGNVEPSRQQIKSLIQGFTWKEKYSKLKNYARAIKNREVLTDEQLEELDYLFHYENSSARREILINPGFNSVNKSDLLDRLREQNIFILSHGAIEAYYPKIDGLSNLDKPSKALKAIEHLKSNNDFRSLLPIILVDSEQRCELEVIFEKIFL